MGLTFDASGDAVVVPSAADITNIFAGGGTLSLWAYFTSYGTNDRGRVMDKEQDGTEGWLWHVRNTSGQQELVFSHWLSSSRGSWETPDGVILLNTWYHLVLTYNEDSASNDPQMFIDAVSQSITQTSSTSGSSEDDSVNDLLIGGRLDPDRDFGGIISDVRIYDRILSDDEITTIYEEKGADDILQGLIRRWPMSPLTPNKAANTSYIDDTRQTISSSSIDVAVPDNVQSGDLLVITIVASGTSGTAPNITTPAGWTEEVHLDLPSTISTPVLAVYSKSATGSEPADYTVTSSTTSSLLAVMSAYRGVATTSANVSTQTGTTISPISPSVTPSSDALVIRVMAADGLAQPSPSRSMYPDNVRGRRTFEFDGGSGNGATIGVAEEHWDATATGTRTWTLDASDQWGAATITFLGGDGKEGLPIKDVSNAKGHAETWGTVVGAEDELRVNI